MELTIIIPVYNVENHLSRCLDSIFVGNNIDGEFEVIAVDDGSTDNSYGILQEYAFRYKQLKIYHQENQGSSVARNKALDVATGKYIMFVDSDDFIDDGLLERCEKILQRKSTDAVIFSYKYVYPKLSRKDICFHYKSSDYYSLKEWLNEFYQLWSCHILHCIGTKVYRKSVIDQYNIRFNESISYLEDISFALEYLSHISNIYYHRFLLSPVRHVRDY